MQQKQILRLIASLQAEERFSSAQVVHSLMTHIEDMEKVLLAKDSELTELRKDAMSDHLTNLMNRRVLEKEIERAIAASTRRKTENALLLVDLNGFKEVNDTYGHDAGDAVLKHVAELLVHNTRPSDVVARLGGDEFCVLMPEIGSRTHIENRVAALVDIISVTPCTYRGVELQVSGSVGCHFFSGDADVASVLKKADAAMYQQKAAAPRRRKAQTVQMELASSV